MNTKEKPKYYSKSQFIRKSGITLSQLEYLFRADKLRRDDFFIIGGQIAYTDADIKKIKAVLAKNHQGQKRQKC